jgi:HAE1 family hydrophobic/amphiphilic exporter-1
VDGERSATIAVTPGEADLGTLTADLQTAIDSLDLPAGVDVSIGGVAADQSDAFGDLGLALVIAVVIVYLVMVATFRSLAQPLILLVSVPFAATGALLMLLATGTPLGVPALIGVLMLVGIVVTNAIVLIDLVNQYRERGRPLAEAVTEGARKRLRPIVMTAAATVLALTPMAIGVTGGGVFISQPLALVVIGGLISSTVLTLLLVPVLYTSLESRRERRAQRRERRAAEKADRELQPA